MKSKKQKQEEIEQLKNEFAEAENLIVVQFKVSEGDAARPSLPRLSATVLR